MKAITIMQPWAWAIAAGHKRVENRKVRTNYRGPIAIHAGKSEAWLQDGLAFLHQLGIDPPAELVFGAVLATADLVDCLELEPGDRLQRCRSKFIRGLLEVDPRLQTPFASGPYCYVLDNIRPLATPFPCRGQQGFFHVELPEPVAAS